MHVITLAGSEHQKSRLRNGHKVRVKHGGGFNVIVNPTTYGLVSRAFNRNKGTTMQLSPEEIAMNKSPSPELQAQIMGHNDHLILPTGPGGELIRGSGIGDIFKDMGNKIKGAYETVRDAVRTPIENKIINPIKNAYEKTVPEDIRRDISTGAKIMSPQYLLTDAISKVRAGKNPVEIFNQYRDDLKHLNNTKNKVIKSSPVLTEAYKKGVMTTAGLGSAALGTTLGLNPVTGALAGAAGSMAARELLKAEGYGLHTPVLAQIAHAIDKGVKHHYHELKHHSKPIGGALNLSHIKNFFTNAGEKIQGAVKAVIPVAKKGANEIHNFLLNNPALAAKVKEHGSKLAGMLAKMGVNYLAGDEKYGDEAESMGSKLADEQIHKNLGYGLTAGITGGGLGAGLYAGKMRGMGQFHSFNSLRDAANGYATANELLGDMSKSTVYGQHYQRPIQKYYEGDLEPRSRGTGIHPHTMHHIQQDNHLHHRNNTKMSHDTNLIRGRGTLIEHDAQLPPAMVSQPYGANFHLQFQLPPQYHKYNDGTYTY